MSNSSSACTSIILVTVFAVTCLRAFPLESKLVGLCECTARICKYSKIYEFVKGTEVLTLFDRHASCVSGALIKKLWYAQVFDICGTPGSAQHVCRPFRQNGIVTLDADKAGGYTMNSFNRIHRKQAATDHLLYLGKTLKRARHDSSRPSPSLCTPRAPRVTISQRHSARASCYTAVVCCCMVTPQPHLATGPGHVIGCAVQEQACGCVTRAALCRQHHSRHRDDGEGT